MLDLRVDQRRWTITKLRGDHVLVTGPDTPPYGHASRLTAEEWSARCSVDVVPASVVAVYRDALREIAEARSLEEVAGILANGPLAAAPGGVREDESLLGLMWDRDEARAQVAALMEEVERLRTELSAVGTADAERVRKLVDGVTYWDEAAIDEARAEGVQRERADSLALGNAALTARVAALTEEVDELREKREVASADAAIAEEDVERWKGAYLDATRAAAAAGCVAGDAEVEIARLSARVEELELVVDDRHEADCGYYDQGLREGVRRERERLKGDGAREVVVDFFDAWRFCPVSRSDNSPRPCLEDAAAQLLAALAAVLSSEQSKRGDAT